MISEDTISKIKQNFDELFEQYDHYLINKQIFNVSYLHAKYLILNMMYNQWSFYNRAKMNYDPTVLESKEDIEKLIDSIYKSDDFTKSIIGPFKEAIKK